jgi:acyl-CoA thioester hydrolase
VRKQGDICAAIDIDVAFHDVDLGSVVWHGHYLKYLENARWALMDQIGFGLQAMLDSGYVWPIIDLHVKYIRPSRFGSRLRTQASLIEWQNRLVIHYLITNREGDQTRVARARSVQVAVDQKTGSMQYPTPDCLLHRVQSHANGT